MGGPDGVSLDRRCFLAGAAAALVGAPARAAAPSLTVGDFTLSVISDGHLVLPTRFLAPEASAAERAAALAQAGQSGDIYQSPTNVTLIRAGAQTILVDTGSGATFMATAGKLLDNLEIAGVTAETVTAIVYTHGHPDHLWGTVDALDDLAFPNARYVIAAAEWDFWHGADAARGLPEDRAGFVTGARRNFGRIKERVTMVKDGDDIVPGLAVVATPGHTQGHISLMIARGDGVLIGGDALTHPVISFQHPGWRTTADHEGDRAAATRARLLDRLASERTRLVGFHLPAPGIGRVERQDGAYRFVAE